MVILLFDQVQYSKEWESEIKRFVDYQPQYRILATGSTSIVDRQSIAERGEDQNNLRLREKSGLVAYCRQESVKKAYCVSKQDKAVDVLRFVKNTGRRCYSISSSLSSL